VHQRDVDISPGQALLRPSLEVIALHLRWFRCLVCSSSSLRLVPVPTLGGWGDRDVAFSRCWQDSCALGPPQERVPGRRQGGLLNALAPHVCEVGLTLVVVFCSSWATCVPVTGCWSRATRKGRWRRPWRCSSTQRKRSERGGSPLGSLFWRSARSPPLAQPPWQVRPVACKQWARTQRQTLGQDHCKHPPGEGHPLQHPSPSILSLRRAGTMLAQPLRGGSPAPSPPAPALATSLPTPPSYSPPQGEEPWWHARRWAPSPASSRGSGEPGGAEQLEIWAGAAWCDADGTRHCWLTARQGCGSGSVPGSRCQAGGCLLRTQLWEMLWCWGPAWARGKQGKLIPACTHCLSLISL